MQTEYKYTDGEVVQFDTGGLSGTGVVRGASHTVPVIGVGYIIEVQHSNVPLPNAEFPFAFTVIHELYINNR